MPFDTKVSYLGIMLREDYNKLIQIFNSSSRNPDIYADYVICSNKPAQAIIKIMHKRCPHLFIDIFPYDKYCSVLTEKEQLTKTINIKKIRKVMQKCCKKNAELNSIQEIINKNIQELLADQCRDGDYMWGLDFSHYWKNWFSGERMLFPLKEIQFENFLFPCINDIEGYLKKVYGNYKEYPKKFGYGHNMFAKLSKEDVEVIKDLRSYCEKSFNLRNL